MDRRYAAVPVLATLLMLASGCGGGDVDADAGGASAGDPGTCLKDATAVTSEPDAYPASFPLPAGTVVFHIEDRGADGVIATGITATPFHDVLAAMNAAGKAGYKVTSGETEEDDAEANWTGNGLTGRWAIKESATCPGQTVVQLLSRKD